MYATGMAASCTGMETPTDELVTGRGRPMPTGADDRRRGGGTTPLTVAKTDADMAMKVGAGVERKKDEAEGSHVVTSAPRRVHDRSRRATR